jgi:hypothetical protein
MYSIVQFQKTEVFSVSSTINTHHLGGRAGERLATYVGKPRLYLGVFLAILP